jgi:hypothetical protein
MVTATLLHYALLQLHCINRIPLLLAVLLHPFGMRHAGTPEKMFQRS